MGISQGFVSLELTPLKGGSRRRKRERKNLRHVTVLMRLLSRCRGCWAQEDRQVDGSHNHYICCVHVYDFSSSSTVRKTNPTVSTSTTHLAAFGKRRRLLQMAHFHFLAFLPFITVCMSHAIDIHNL